MTVRDLKPGMSCTLLTMRKKGKYQSDSTIVRIEGSTIFVKAVIVNNRVVNFGHISNFLIVNVEDDSPQIFQYIVPEIYNEGNSHFYRINLKSKFAVTYDRRKNFRARINKTANARFDDSTSTRHGLLKNISAVGFALVLDGANLPRNHTRTQNIHVSFTDTDPEFGLQTSFELTGEVRRIVNTRDGKILFGCHFPYSYNIEKFVLEKERIRRIRARTR